MIYIDSPFTFSRAWPSYGRRIQKLVGRDQGLDPLIVSLLCDVGMVEEGILLALGELKNR